MSHVLIYSKNNQSKLINVINIVLEKKLIPIVVDDHSNFDVKLILRQFYHKIDLISFDVNVGFSEAIKNGIRHFLRGSNGKTLIFINSNYDDPFYLTQLIQSYKKNPASLYLLENYKDQNDIIFTLIDKVFYFFIHLFYQVKVTDIFTSYFLVERSFLQKNLMYIENLDNFLLTKIILLLKNKEFTYKKSIIDNKKDFNFYLYWNFFCSLF